MKKRDNLSPVWTVNKKQFLFVRKVSLVMVVILGMNYPRTN